MKALTLRLPDELHEELRQEAFDSRRSITAIILEAIEARADFELRQRQHDKQRDRDMARGLRSTSKEGTIA